MAPILTYESGMYFGELALLAHQPRQGTIKTITGCSFACITHEVYDRLWKKDNALQIERNVSFIRQIPYITNWKNKEVISLIYKCQALTCTRG